MDYPCGYADSGFYLPRVTKVTCFVTCKFQVVCVSLSDSNMLVDRITNQSYP